MGDLQNGAVADLRAHREHHIAVSGCDWCPDVDESTCQACGGHNPVWWTTNPAWNEVAGAESGLHFLCPTCFIKRADDGTRIWAVIPAESRGPS